MNRVVSTLRGLRRWACGPWPATRPRAAAALCGFCWSIALVTESDAKEPGSQGPGAPPFAALSVASSSLQSSDPSLAVGGGANAWPWGQARPANQYEIVGLYASSAGYGLGIGIWLSAEFGLKDPGVVLIPPTLFGVAAPITARLLNRPRMPRGLPAAISAGLTLGAGEALALVGVQATRADDPWALKSAMRAVALGSTLGGAAGYWFGLDQLPSPNLSTFVITGALVGGGVGAMFGYGSTRDGERFARADDALMAGTLIGLNGGVAATALLGTLFVPTVSELRWTWLGAAAGAVVSLPAYALYIGKGAPPIKRGLLFTGTTTLLGAVGGAVLGPELGGPWTNSLLSRRLLPIGGIRVSHVLPMPVPGGVGVALVGSL